MGRCFLFALLESLSLFFFYIEYSTDYGGLALMEVEIVRFRDWLLLVVMVVVMVVV